MQIRPKLEAVVDEMLDGHIMLDEALEEFEKLYIEKAYHRNKKRISNTAAALGIHRNTISKRVNAYRAQERERQARETHKPKPKTLQSESHARNLTRTSPLH